MRRPRELPILMIFVNIVAMSKYKVFVGKNYLPLLLPDNEPVMLEASCYNQA